MEEEQAGYLASIVATDGSYLAIRVKNSHPYLVLSTSPGFLKVSSFDYDFNDVKNFEYKKRVFPLSGILTVKLKDGSMLCKKNIGRSKKDEQDVLSFLRTANGVMNWLKNKN